jgi:hypothetical protein
MIITRLRTLAPLAALTLFVACANPREDARDELHRLRGALDEHRTRFGRYPQTLDPARPADVSNLAFTPREGIAVRLVHAGDDGIQALAQRAPWICSLHVDPQRGERIECTPVSASAGNVDDVPGDAPNPLDSVLRPGGLAGDSAQQ